MNKNRDSFQTTEFIGYGVGYKTFGQWLELSSDQIVLNLLKKVLRNRGKATFYEEPLSIQNFGDKDTIFYFLGTDPLSNPPIGQWNPLFTFEDGKQPNFIGMLWFLRNHWNDKAKPIPGDLTDSEYIVFSIMDS